MKSKKKNILNIISLIIGIIVSILTAIYAYFLQSCRIIDLEPLDELPYYCFNVEKYMSNINYIIKPICIISLLIIIYSIIMIIKRKTKEEKRIYLKNILNIIIPILLTIVIVPIIIGLIIQTL